MAIYTKLPLKWGHLFHRDTVDKFRNEHNSTYLWNEGPFNQDTVNGPRLIEIMHDYVSEMKVPIYINTSCKCQQPTKVYACI